MGRKGLKVSEPRDADRILRDLHEQSVRQFGEAEFQAALDRARLKRELAMILRTRRQALGMDQRVLAERANITQQQLSRYENGRTSPSMDRMVELLKAMGLSLVIEGKDGQVLARV